MSDDELIAMFDAGMSARGISRETGVGGAVVKMALYRGGRLPDKSREALGDKFEAVVEGWADGMQIAELALLAGMTHDAMKWRVAVMRATGALADRPKTPVNKGRVMPMRAKHRAVYEAMVQVPGWEKMARGDLAKALKMPVSVFILYWRVFRNRGMVSPKANGRRKGSASDVKAVARGLAARVAPEQQLWALALGRRVV